MTSTVTIIDYGIGNLRSVCQAFEHLGSEVLQTDSPQAIEESERLVLPGVGAFADGMEGLRSAGLIEPILRYVATGRPFLGICLGMQMMMEVGEEFGEHKGLGSHSRKSYPYSRYHGSRGASQGSAGWLELSPHSR